MRLKAARKWHENAIFVEYRIFVVSPPEIGRVFMLKVKQTIDWFSVFVKQILRQHENCIKV